MWRILPILLLPVLEVWTLFQAEATLGLGWTLAYCVVALVAGLAVARGAQGRLARRLQEGPRVGFGAVTHVDATRASEDLLIAFGGLALAFPGLVSDVIALFLLVPPTRRGLFRWVARKLAPPSSRTGSASAPDVEIYPPGTLGPALPKRPRVIDIH